MNHLPDLLGLPYTRLRWIDAGSFEFQDKIKITIDQGFYAGCYPVTQQLYEAVTGENPANFKGKHRPVEQVSWDNARHFLDVFNQKVKLDDGLQFRLPSETMWEYAARAGQDFAYSGSQKLPEAGWFDDNAHGQTMPVGLKEPNAWGLYDMSGNVWEWCEDDWEADEALLKSTRGVQPFKKNAIYPRVLRGGSWADDGYDARVLVRIDYLHGLRNYGVGFRVFRY